MRYAGLQYEPAAHSLPGGVGLVDPDGQRYPGEQELQDTAAGLEQELKDQFDTFEKERKLLKKEMEEVK